MVLKKLLPFFALAVVILIFFNQLALGDLILARGDVQLYFYPYWHQASAALRAGHIPLWNPALFMGTPFLANSQVGFFYPLNWPLWLLLPAPEAVNASILLHLFIAGSGTYLAGRKCLKLDLPASLIAAVLFSLGGYVTAQIEHVNQVQGITWLPWFLLATGTWKSSPGQWRSAAKLAVILSLLFALQILAGHTQTAFITFVGLFIWLTAQATTDWWRSRSVESSSRRFHDFFVQIAYTYFPLFIAIIMTAILASVQILPTLELTAYSSRQGGLPVNEALSFSLHPLLLTRSLFPAYVEPIFSEYIAFLPLAALILAFIAAWNWHRRAGAFQSLVLAASGLFLALGIFNPFYQLLVRSPGFNLFRAPARWMILYALGLALLAGLGWQILADESKVTRGERFQSEIRRPAIVVVIIIVALMVWALIAVNFSSWLPVGTEASVTVPPTTTFLGWIAELLIAIVILIFLRRLSGLAKIGPLLIAGILMLVLFLGTRALSYNHPTTPEAFYELRPPISRLQLLAGCPDQDDNCEQPGARYLSLSNIFFDIGDQAEIDSIYQDQLSERARFDYTVATKQKEIIGPNLSMIYGLSAVDGFDGGILPLGNFSEVVRLIMPSGERNIDGRLREHLSSVPEEKWLDLFNAGYVITDKVEDVWREDVFFDRQHTVTMKPQSPPVSVGHVPAYESTGLWLLTEGHPGAVEVVSTSGKVHIVQPTVISDELFQVSWPEPMILQSISILPCTNDDMTANGCAGSYRLLGLALVDSRDETFQPVVPGQYRLIHSGDVKIYENLDALPRAFIVYNWIFRPTAEAALEAMAQPGFDPSNTAVVLGKGSDYLTNEGRGLAMFREYEPERIRISSQSDAEGLLVLTDAHYPGWKATLDGDPVPIEQVDVLFRGLIIPPGEHEIVLSYTPIPFEIGKIISLLGVVLLAVFAVNLFIIRQKIDG